MVLAPDLDHPNLNGFVICDFSPDEQECECCNKPNLQLYWRSTDPFSSDGEYYCLDCIKSEQRVNDEYDLLMSGQIKKA